MKRSELEAHTRPSLIASLQAAGCTGLSRAKKDELVSAALKLRGGARERFLDNLKESERPAPPDVPKPAKLDAAKLVKPEPIKPPAVREPARAPEKPSASPEPTQLGDAKGRKFDVDRNGIAQGVPEPGDFPLPESYGLDLFHVLIFDPNSAYVFWELTPETLAALAAKYGEKWDARRLCVRALARDGGFVQQELYGDRGSYFLELGFPGQRVAVSLGFLVDGGFEQVLATRAVQFPRDRECESAPVKLGRVKPGQSLKEVSTVSSEEAFGVPLTELGEEYRQWQPEEAASSHRTPGGEGGND